ncbi:MAG: hypothetical protein IKS20_08160 [Victivallales bacterium]|nr:hypothetical protein [Victivallales bacterium]
MASSNENTSQSQAPVLVIGLGHTGINALCSLANVGIGEDVQCLAIDADTKDLEIARQAGINTLRLGDEAQNGGGTAGDWTMGNLLLRDEAENIASLLDGRRLVIVMAGLAGGIGGALDGLLTIMENDNDVPVMALCVMPFHFESAERKRHADEVLPSLSLFCRAVILAPNDIILAQYKDCPASKALALAANFLAETAMDLTIPLAKTNLFNMNPEMIAKICVDSNPQCYIARAKCNSEKIAEISENIAENPLFKLPKFIDNVDRAIALLRVSGECTETDLDNVLSSLSKMLPSGIMEAAACEDNGMDCRIRVTLLLHFNGNFSQTDGAHQAGNARPSRSRRSKGAAEHQLEFSYDACDSLGIFHEDPQPANKDEWLDRPTFVRRGIAIDKGVNISK